MFENIRASWRLATTPTLEVNDRDYSNYHTLMHAGGFSHNHVTGAAPTTGFMVGQPASKGGVEHKIPLEEFTPGHLAAHRNAAGSAMNDPHTYQGGWIQDGHVHLDVSKNIQDRDEAIREGKKNNQIAIYDVAGNRDIPTGGKGA